MFVCVCVLSGGRPLLQRKTVDQEKDGQNNGSEEFQNQIFSPAEMRMRMMGELQKREEIFSCELELQQLEQSHAMKAASQAMQQYVMQNEVHKRNISAFNVLPCLALPSPYYYSFYLIAQHSSTKSHIPHNCLLSSISSLLSLLSLLLPPLFSPTPFFSPSWTASSADPVTTLSCSSKHTSSP